jgi:lysophospholipase L1-like esterase
MKRRIIAALAATGLAVTMAVAVAPASQASVVWGEPYVAVGDSVAAGTGNLPYIDEECLRSEKAYPNMLADMVGSDVTSVACTGSPTGTVLEQAQALIGSGVIGPATELVTITAAVNDLPWTLVLGACSNQGSPELCQQLMSAAPGAGAGIVTGIATILGTVRLAAPAAQIVVTGYPYPFGEFSGMCSVGAYAPGKPLKFSADGASMINDAVDGLNLAIQGGIAQYQLGYFAATGQQDAAIHWVDVTDDFMGHGFCDTGERWFGGTIPTGPVVDRGFHPNVAGQQGYAAAIYGELMP